MLAAAMATQGPVVEKSKGQTRQSGPAATAAEIGFCGSLHLEAFRRCSTYPLLGSCDLGSVDAGIRHHV